MTHEIKGVRVEKYALFCQQTSPKRWFGNMDMTSNCDVTNSAHQIQMTTIWPWTKPPWKFSAYATDWYVLVLHNQHVVALKLSLLKTYLIIHRQYGSSGVI